MEKKRAERLVIAAARRVAETQPGNFPFDQQYVNVLTQRVVRLRMAIRDLDQAVDDKKMDADED